MPRYFSISVLTWLWILYILTGSFYMRMVLNYLIASLGRNSVSLLIWAFFAGLGLLAFRKLFQSGGAQLSFILVFSLGLVFAFYMPLPEERIHIIKFGILGLLLSRDLSSSTKIKSVMLPIFLGTMLAAIDESFQYFIPNRVADSRDVAFGFMGTLWGTALFYFSRRLNY